MSRITASFCIAAIATAVAASPAFASDAQWAAVAEALGKSGTEMAGGVYRVGMPRTDLQVTLDGVALKPPGGGKAAITGDFVLIASEVTPVMRTLRDNGIDVTALHKPMLDDQPRVFFMHFWANDDAAKLAKGLRAALDKVNLAKTAK